MPNSIHHCPKCNYPLVLIERRGKFKCAKCGKLFLQRQIEDESFRRWNQKMKEKNENDFLIELQQRKRKPLTEEEKRLKLGEYIEKNKERIKARADKWRQENRDYYNFNKKEYYHKNLDYSRHLMRMKHWRNRQVELALNELKVDLILN